MISPGVDGEQFPTIVSRFGYSPAGPAVWRKDEATGLEFRDLSLAQASEDAFVGRHLRATGQRGEGLVIDRACAFAFIFVVRGSVTLEVEGKSPLVLEVMDCATRHGIDVPARLRFSEGAEVVEMVASPAKPDLFGSGDGQWVISRETKDDYKVGDGPRSFFSYRDLGITAATARRIHIHVVKAEQSRAGGTGWHSHSMGQLFYVLRGWAELTVEHQPAVRMTEGDAMCIAKRMRHDVPAFSDDYMVLEMCIPADYDTIDATAA